MSAFGRLQPFHGLRFRPKSATPSNKRKFKEKSAVKEKELDRLDVNGETDWMSRFLGLFQLLVLTLLVGATEPASAKWNPHYQTEANTQFENSALRGGCVGILPGQYFDQETGLHYNHFRYYDPSIGRYITSDPIGLDGGVNTYLYANANSLRWVDPLGLWPFGLPGKSDA